jgi:hypothetical protein
MADPFGTGGVEREIELPDSNPGRLLSNLRYFAHQAR